ncbi:MAG: cytochrome c oxidase assembly factor Coa1 family protein [Candidatus Omnitrophota bacterium]
MEQQINENWWNRNWKWFVPISSAVVIILFVGLTVLILSLAFGMFKSSDIYKEALSKAESNSVVGATLGVPIKEGFFISGNISTNGPSGSAELAIPVSGPKGSGTIFVEASKSAGRWSFSTFIFESDQTKQRTNLLVFSGSSSGQSVNELLKQDPNFKIYPVIFGITVGTNGTIDSFRMTSVIDPTSKPGETPKTINLDVPEKYIKAAKKKAEAKHYEQNIKDGKPEEIFTYYYYSPSYPDTVITDWSKPVDEQP